MNISFPAGILASIALMMLGIVFGKNFGYTTGFFNVPGLLITVGGTMTALFASFPAKAYVLMFQNFPIILGFRKQNPLYYINIMTELSEEARKKGLLELEDSVAQYDDAFLRDSVMLIVDAMEPDKVRERLENELHNIEERHARCWEIYDKGAAFAPAFGMIGTIIGLVNMLSGMDFEDEGGATRLAANMAVALMSTLYGIIMANILFIPAGNQLRSAHADEILCKEIIIEGAVSIQAGENPHHIKEKLMSYLTYKDREKATSQSKISD